MYNRNALAKLALSERGRGANPTKFKVRRSTPSGGPCRTKMGTTPTPYHSDGVLLAGRQVRIHPRSRGQKGKPELSERRGPFKRMSLRFAGGDPPGQDIDAFRRPCAIARHSAVAHTF